MIFLGFEEHFGLTAVNGCEDVGLAAIREMGGDDLWHVWMLWIALAFAFAGCESILAALFGGKIASFALGDRKAYRVIPSLVAVWAWSTLISLVTLMTFGRQPIALGWKFVHVFSELSHLMYVLLLWDWFSSGTLILVVACVALMASISMPCQIATAFTAIGGVLDTANWIVCMLVGVDGEDRRNRSAFVALRTAFLWHMSYIHSYLLMAWVVSPNVTHPDSVAWLRMYGVLANSFAVYWAAIAIDRLVVHDDDDDDAASTCTRGSNAVARMFSRALQLRCVPSTDMSTFDVLQVPRVGWTAPADLNGSVICACLLITNGLTGAVQDDESHVVRKMGPLAVSRTSTKALRVPPRMWVATRASVRRGRVVAWMLRISVARALTRYGIYWLVSASVGIFAPSIAISIVATLALYLRGHDTRKYTAA